MGHHINPQFYLRGFSPQEEPELWVYEKGKENARFLPIKAIAQESDFYGDKERYLASEIEKPANKVLTKVINREPISPAEKETFSRYVFMFFKRVPKALERFREKVPEVSKKIKEEWDTLLEDKKRTDPTKSARYDKLKGDVHRILNGYETNMPKDIWLNSLSTGSMKPIDYMKKMTWILLTCKEPDVFLTGDNPVFYHERMGIGKPDSEMTFPISKNVLLFANWWKVKDLSYTEAGSEFIKEANRRTVLNATRFIYSPVNRDWIVKLMNKKSLEIHLISPPT